MAKVLDKGGRFIRKYVCSECGAELESDTTERCPACGASLLTKQKADKEARAETREKEEQNFFKNAPRLAKAYWLFAVFTLLLGIFVGFVFGVGFYLLDRGNKKGKMTSTAQGLTIALTMLLLLSLILNIIAFNRPFFPF